MSDDDRFTLWFWAIFCGAIVAIAWSGAAL